MAVCHKDRRISVRGSRRGLMKSVVGIFTSRSGGEAVVDRLRAIGMDGNRVSLLTPAEPDVSAVPTSDTEQPGMGAALGGVVGGAIGAASGMALGATVASLLVPGVGPVIATGVAGAALLAAGGATGGVLAGEALEDAMSNGLPGDELFGYEHALQQGRTVVIVFANDDVQANHAREIMQSAGAESIDTARHRWWIGLRDAEAEDYLSEVSEFETSEETYRRGFETA